MGSCEFVLKMPLADFWYLVQICTFFKSKYCNISIKTLQIWTVIYRFSIKTIKNVFLFFSFPFFLFYSFPKLVVSDFLSVKFAVYLSPTASLCLASWQLCNLLIVRSGQGQWGIEDHPFALQSSENIDDGVFCPASAQPQGDKKPPLLSPLLDEGIHQILTPSTYYPQG